MRFSRLSLRRACRGAARCVAPLVAALALAGPVLAAAPTAASDCPPPPALPGAEEVRIGLRDAQDHGFLWRVRRDGRESFLYGTIHVARQAWMYPGRQVRAALQQAGTVALELDLLDPNVQERMRRALAREADRAPLPAPLAARLSAALAASCIEPQEAAALGPQMQAITLVVSAARRLGLEPAYGVDGFLAGLAHGLAKDVRSLETPEDQVRLLVSDDPDEAAQSVGDMLDELDRGTTARQLARLAEVWRDGRLQELDDYGQWCGCLDTPRERQLYTRMIDDRNVAMAARIAEWHAQGHSVFVAVGSLHMAGPRGLPALLRARGFSVERVPLGPSP